MKLNEREIEQELVTKCLLAGGECRKVNWLGRRGAPDRIVMLPRAQAIWVELKAPGKRPEPHQAREHDRMRAMGQRVEVIDSLEGVTALFK